MKLFKVLFYTKCPHCKEWGIRMIDKTPNKFGYSKCSCKYCDSEFKVNPCWLYISAFVSIVVLLVIKMFIDLPIWIIAVLVCIILELIYRVIPLEEND
ncbi:MAG: hypothetical protein NC397_04905 [Clostridium sp.]|nr:hypothetical protein [Clostridium sp.]